MSLTNNQRGPQERNVTEGAPGPLTDNQRAPGPLTDDQEFRARSPVIKILTIYMQNL